MGKPPYIIEHERFPEENEDEFRLTIDGTKAGYALTIGPRLPEGDVWILEISVHPSHRGRGYASALLAAVIAHYDGYAFGLSCQPFTADAWPENLPDAVLRQDELVAWYERHGFQKTDDPDDDYWFMARPRSGCRLLSGQRVTAAEAAQ